MNVKAKVAHMYEYVDVATDMCIGTCNAHCSWTYILYALLCDQAVKVIAKFVKAKGYAVQPCVSDVLHLMDRL